jgi:hypothetical protein
VLLGWDMASLGNKPSGRSGVEALIDAQRLAFLS